MTKLIDAMKSEISRCEVLSKVEPKKEDELKTIAIILAQTIANIEANTLLDKECSDYVEAVNMIDSLDFNKHNYEINIIKINR